MRVRPMTPADADAVLAIYQAGLDGGDASFETTAPTWEVFDRGKLPDHRLVAVDGNAVAGWIAVSPTSTRLVYAGVVEHSVYVDPAARSRGVGRALLEELVRRADACGIWTIQAGILAGNDASVALHARCGFRVVGTRERIARKNGEWRDVVLMERRSALVA